MKNKKVIVGIVAAVLVVGVVGLVGQSELFQGRLRLFNMPLTTHDLNYSKLFWYKNKIVSAVTSPVTSPVPSVVVSDVTSPLGTSRVASVVTSPVASPVASAVTVDDKDASKIDTRKLKDLTEFALKSIAEQDYRNDMKFFEQKAREEYSNNPERFTLSEKEKQSMIELYQRKNPLEFIFVPATR